MTDRDDNVTELRKKNRRALQAIAGGRGHADERGVNGRAEVVLPPPAMPMSVAKELINTAYTEDGCPLLRSWRGAFWRWERSRWVEVEDAAVRAEVYRFTEHATFLNDKGEAKPWAPNRYKVADTADALRAVGHVPEAVNQPSWLGGQNPVADRPTEIVACNNGLLSVTTRKLIAHNPRFFNGVAVPFDFDAAAGKPQRWLSFLDDLWPNDPDSIAALQEFFGYVVSARTDLQKILLLVGPTRAGKGVIARILKELIGTGNAAGPTLASLGTNFGLSPLIGKPLAIVSDARLGGANTHQVVERLLSVSGEDMLTIDRKYREPWTGTLNARFVVISNELPRFGDASGAIANRFIVLTLGRSWLGRENPALTRELTTEMTGIFNWALDGLDRLNEVGRFSEPASSRDAVLALQDLASPVSAFVRDTCIVDPAQEVPVTELFAAWKEWCDTNGRDRPGTVQTFGRDLRAVVPGLDTIRPRTGDDARERRYSGIGIRTTEHNALDRGPLRTGPLVHDGPQSTPLSALVDGDPPSGPLNGTRACKDCDQSTRDISGLCAGCVEARRENR